MILYAGPIALAFIFGAVASVIAVALGIAWPDPTPEPPEHECPYCGETLRAITVQDVDDPPPAGARWYCRSSTQMPATHDCDGNPRIRYFADRPAAKPAATEEL